MRLSIFENSSNQPKLSPEQLIDKLKGIQGLDPAVIFKRDFFRYMDETDMTVYAGLAIQSLGQVDQIMAVQKPNHDYHNRVSASVQHRAPTEEQRRVPADQPIKTDPSFIHVQVDREGELYLGVSWPVKPDFRFDMHRKTVVSYRVANSARSWSRTVELQPHDNSEEEKEIPELEPAIAANTSRQALEILIPAFEATLAERPPRESRLHKLFNALGYVARPTSLDN